MTNAAFKALQGAGTSALAVGADQLAAARGVLEAVQTAWQQGAGTVLSAMLARFTSDARWQQVDFNAGQLGLAPTLPPPPKSPWSGDFLKDASNFFAGWADTLTFNLTARFRAGLGYDDVVDKNSSAYSTGSSIGQLHNALLMWGASGAGGALSAGQRLLQVTAIAGNVANAVDQFKDGDLGGAIFSLLQAGLAAMWGNSACQQVNSAAQVLHVTLLGVNAGHALIDAFGRFSQGDWFGGLVDLADAGISVYLMGCFAAGTPLLTPTGHKAIEPRGRAAARSPTAARASPATRCTKSTATTVRRAARTSAPSPWPP